MLLHLGHGSLWWKALAGKLTINSMKNTNTDYQKVYTIMHELFHVMYFNPALIRRFIDKDGNRMPLSSIVNDPVLFEKNLKDKSRYTKQKLKNSLLL